MALVEYANGGTGLVGAVPEPMIRATLGLGLAIVALMLGEDPIAQVSKRVLLIIRLQGAITKRAPSLSTRFGTCLFLSERRNGTRYQRVPSDLCDRDQHQECG